MLEKMLTNFNENSSISGETIKFVGFCLNLWELISYMGCILEEVKNTFTNVCSQTVEFVLFF